MKRKNKITDVTRQHIAEEVSLNMLWYHGNLTEPDFLARLFDLQSLPSRDYRYKNAYDEIHQHMVNNFDWAADWYLTDPRINILHTDDEIYLKFLAMTLHPRVRTKTEEIDRLLEIYNRHLYTDGYEIAHTDEISSKPVYS